MVEFFFALFHLRIVHVFGRRLHASQRLLQTVQSIVDLRPWNRLRVNLCEALRGVKICFAEFFQRSHLRDTHFHE